MMKKLFKKYLPVVGMTLILASSDAAATCAWATEASVYVTAVVEQEEIAKAEDVSEESVVDSNQAEIEISEEAIDAYFANSVFLGDSIMLGFRNYSRKQSDSFVKQIQFLAAGSYSATNSHWGTTKESVHPLYQGKKLQAWDSISMIAPDKVFICLGLNDLNISGLEGSLEKYKELIRKIKEKSPEVEIHIISMTYVLNGASSGKLNNDTIREYNQMLLDAALENGWGYIDVANALADENGDLAELYCSDGFVHQTPEAYDVWCAVLREYARAVLEIQEQVEMNLAIVASVTGENLETELEEEPIALESAIKIPAQSNPFRQTCVDAILQGAL